MSKSFNSLSRLSGQHGTMPSSVQRRYLSLGLKQAGGKLPLFDKNGQKVKAATIRACMSAGWCKPWFANPIEPSWLVCKLTDGGRTILGTENFKNKVN